MSEGIDIGLQISGKVVVILLDNLVYSALSRCLFDEMTVSVVIIISDVSQGIGDGIDLSGTSVSEISIRNAVLNDGVRVACIEISVISSSASEFISG
jgi:hypothetical protein